MNVQGLDIKGQEKVLSGCRTVVVGLGVSGVATSKFLKRCGSDVVATDIMPASMIEGARELMEMGITVEAGSHHPESFRSADLIVVSPGVPLDLPVIEEARRRGVEITGEIELASRFITSPIIAVAGTNGKTTTATLLGSVLETAGKKVFVGGNIGTPAIEYVDEGINSECLVLEISSFHLETIKHFRPFIGLLLNITEDHLDRYSSFNEYSETKFRLFMNQTEGDFSVLNVGDPVISKLVAGSTLKGSLIPYSSSGRLKEGLYLEGEDIVYQPAGGNKREPYPTGGFKIKGLHNLENVMAVIAAARSIGAPRDAVLEAVEGFEGLHHRMEFIREHEGVSYINDSKGTNVGSLLAALNGINSPVVLIAGGKDKGGSYSVLNGLVKEKVKLLILLGEARGRINEELGGLTKTVLVDTMEDAVAAASKNAVSGDTVLLGPACSSFDMFRDYKERGEAFRRLVEDL